MKLAKKPFHFFLIFVIYLGGLCSPQFEVAEIPLVFIIPIFFTTLLIIVYPLINKDMFYFSVTILMSLAVSFFPLILIESNFFSYKSFFLFFVSFAIFLIYSSTFLNFLRTSSPLLIEKLSYRVLVTLFVICIFEIFFPDVFSQIRFQIYPLETISESIWRNERSMLGIPRPLFLFNEPSHLAKLFGFFWVLYAISVNFNYKSMIFFVIIFFMMRSPTLFFVIPLFIFYLISLLRIDLKRKFTIFSSVIFSFIVITVTLKDRIFNALEGGEGSFQERYLYPYIYLYENSHFFGAYPIGGHKTLYYAVCEMMASTRHWWSCTTDSVVAANSSFVLFGSIGWVGILLLLFLMVYRFRNWGFYYVLSFFVVQFFLTGFNTPSNFVITGFILGALFFYSLKYYGNNKYK